MPNKMYITKYQHATTIQAHVMMHSATGTSKSHFSHTLSASVIFQMRCAEPMKDSGADRTTFSDANFSLI